MYLRLNKESSLTIQKGVKTMLRKLCFEPLEGRLMLSLTPVVTVPDHWYVGDYHVLEGNDFPAGKKANMTITLSDGEVIRDSEKTGRDGSFKEGMTIEADDAGGIATYTVRCGGVTVSQQFTVIADPTLFVPETITAGSKDKITGKGFYPYLDDEIYFYASQGDGDWMLLDHDDVDSRGRVNEATNFPDNLVNGLNTIEARLADGTVLTSATTTIVGGIEPSLPELPVSPFIILVMPATQVSASSPVSVSSPTNGALEQQSLAERAAREIALTETIKRIGLTYYDEGRGVDVYAPTGQYFVEYANGAVELRFIPAGLPAGQDHPLKDEITVNGRSSPNLGQVPKLVARTGRTFFDPARGIDVYAGEGKFLVEYEDGTIEERNLPAGGFVPLPTDFTVGGSDNSQPKSAFGPSLEELGLVDSITNRPKPSEELYLIGETYVSSSGVLRTAHAGNIFLQDPVTGIILERPKADAGGALTKPSVPEVSVHSRNTITDLFFQAYGRDPNGLELTYWQSRTDKSGAALLGAMQYTSSRDVTVTLKSGSMVPKVVDEVFAALGQVPVSVGGYNTVALTWEWAINDPALLAGSPQGSANTVRDARDLWWQETVEFVPPVPTSNVGLHFYMSSPDYVVIFDMLTPEDVNRIHPGGVTSVRIRPVGSIGGAQVILDAQGNVIPGAGTDDTFSPTNVPLWVGHIVVDVLPWWIGQKLSPS